MCANLLELLVRNPQSLVDVVLERAVDLVHLIERSLKVVGALKQLRFKVDALTKKAGPDQRIELGVVDRAPKLVCEQVIRHDFFCGYSKNHLDHSCGPPRACS